MHLPEPSRLLFFMKTALPTLKRWSILFKGGLYYAIHRSFFRRIPFDSARLHHTQAVEGGKAVYPHCMGRMELGIPRLRYGHLKCYNSLN